MVTKTTKAQLEVMLAEVTRERDVLRSRLDTGHAAFRAAKAEIDRLRAELAAKPRAVFIKPRTEPKPVVTRFYRGGVLWEKTRIGNKATERPVEARREFHVVAGKYDGGEENCKFADVRATRADAEALLATVSDYPWSRIEERPVVDGNAVTEADVQRLAEHFGA